VVSRLPAELSAGRSHDGGRVYDTAMPEPETQNRKHGFFSKEWRRRSILLGLGIHFSCWWALLVWFWRSRWSWTTAASAWYTLTAPIRESIFYLSQPHVEGDFLGLPFAVGILVLTTVSAVKRNRWIVLLTHLCIAIYWFWDCALLAG